MVRYTLTDSKIEIDYGLIARTTRNILLPKIQDVTVSASIPQRILDLATSSLTTPVRLVAKPSFTTSITHVITQRPDFAATKAVALNSELIPKRCRVREHRARVRVLSSQNHYESMGRVRSNYGRHRFCCFWAARCGRGPMRRCRGSQHCRNRLEVSKLGAPITFWSDTFPRVFDNDSVMRAYVGSDGALQRAIETTENDAAALLC